MLNSNIVWTRFNPLSIFARASTSSFERWKHVGRGWNENSSPTKHHDLSTSCPLSSWNDSVTVSVWHGSRISSSRKKRIYRVDTQLRFQASFERGKLIVSKWYRDGDHWISSVFFFRKENICVYREKEICYLEIVLFVFLSTYFEVWWVFENFVIRWKGWNIMAIKDEKGKYSIKKDVL